MKINKYLLLDAVYPVGSIYMSVNSTNPSTLFGGTWTKWGAGRVPVGINTNDTNFNTSEKTGGEKTHTLTKEEIPQHNHKGLNWGSATGKDITLNAGSGQVHISSVSWSGGQAGRVIFTGTNDEGGSSHNNLQPYITCYMWKRTA